MFSNSVAVDARAIRMQSIENIKTVRFITIPYVFTDRHDWNDICRGVTFAETKMKVEEANCHISFLTNTSQFRTRNVH